MVIQPDFIAYHKSIAAEFEANKNQVRNLIGSAHWPSDGEHKEAILRRMLQNRLPDTLRVGTGFFSDTISTSSQIDILITDTSKPTLFRNGDFHIVTPDCVRGIIEVKTRLSGQKAIKDCLHSLSENLHRVRKYQRYRISNNIGINRPSCWGGLFIFDEPTNVDSNHDLDCLLEEVSRTASGDPSRAVNCVTIGSDRFIRFWPNIPAGFGGQLINPGWQSYIFDTLRNEGLSPAYFIGNLVMHISGSDRANSARAWFPIQEGNGKEDYFRDSRELINLSR